jgi:hypothetical protein
MLNKHNKYYLPIQSICLPSYYTHAGIFPSKYLPNRDEDIQSDYRDFLLLSSKIGTSNTNCAIELILTEEENKNLIPSSESTDFFFYNKPLPISRVKAIYFENEDEKKHTIAIINLSSGYIKEGNVKTIADFEKTDVSKIQVPDRKYVLANEVEIKKFDSFLGGFALMKLCGEDYMNYSENYFSTLAFFSEIVEKDLMGVINNNANVKYTNKFHNLFNGTEKFKEISGYLYKKITEQDVIAFAKSQGQKVTKNEYSRVIDYNKLDRESYILAVLFAYGVGNESKIPKIDSLILSKFKSEIKAEYAELIALCYGINRGYSAFTNSYASGNVHRKLKFELNSKLDYYTIESIYQYAFNGINRNGSFEYLDWCPNSNMTVRRGTYRILDQVVIEKKRPKIFSEEFWAKFSDNFPRIFDYTYKDFIEKIVLFASQSITDPLNDIIDSSKEKIELLEKEKSELQTALSLKNKEVEELMKQNENFILVNTIGEKTTADKGYQLDQTLVTKTHVLDASSNVEENSEKYSSLEDRYSKLVKLVEEIKKQTNVASVKNLIKDFKNKGGK